MNPVPSRLVLSLLSSFALLSSASAAVISEADRRVIEGRVLAVLGGGAGANIKAPKAAVPSLEVIPVNAGTPAPARDVQRDFRRLQAWVRGGHPDHIPADLARALRWGDGTRHVDTTRRMLLQRRNSDNVILRRYAADVTVPGGDSLILLSQIIEAPEPDTTLTYLFDRNGRIVRVFELMRDNTTQEIMDSSFDPLGYEIWQLFIGRIPADISDPIVTVPTA